MARNRSSWSNVPATAHPFCKAQAPPRPTPGSISSIRRTAVARGAPENFSVAALKGRPRFPVFAARTFFPISDDNDRGCWRRSSRNRSTQELHGCKRSMSMTINSAVTTVTRLSRNRRRHSAMSYEAAGRARSCLAEHEFASSQPNMRCSITSISRLCFALHGERGIEQIVWSLMAQR